MVATSNKFARDRSVMLKGRRLVRACSLNARCGGHCSRLGRAVREFYRDVTASLLDRRARRLALEHVTLEARAERWVDE